MKANADLHVYGFWWNVNLKQLQLLLIMKGKVVYRNHWLHIEIYKNVGEAWLWKYEQGDKMGKMGETIAQYSVSWLLQ